MKVSIITVSFNSEKTIKDTIESVLKQTYKNIEYIVIDGKSTDNTVKLIKSYEKSFQGKLKWISEKDHGLYDAMDKGIKMATGDIIGILNSDDFFIDKFVVEDVVNKMRESNVDSLYADLVFIDEDHKNKIVRKWVAGKGSFKLGWNPPHPTFFVKKEVYDMFGSFNSNYKIAADYDLLYRFLEKHRITTTYLKRFIVKMRIGGQSTKSLNNIIKGNKEIYNSLKKNRARFPFFIVLIRLIRKISQLIVKERFIRKFKAEYKESVTIKQEI